MKPSRLKLLLILVGLAGLLGLGYFSCRKPHAPLTHDQAFELGSSLLLEGKVREAYSRLSYAARVHPEEAKYHWGAAQAAIRLGDARSAAEHAAGAWERGLKNKDVFLLLVGDASVDRRARIDRGMARLRELPDTRDRRELEGDLLQSAGESAEALKIWSALFDASPAPGLANKIALTHVGLGRPDAARQLLESCKPQGGLDEEGYGLLGSLAAYRDDPASAAAAYAEGRARFESSESLRLNEAVFLIWRDRLAEAAALLEPLKTPAAEPAKAALRSQARVFLGFIRGSQLDRAALDGLVALAAGDGPLLEGERLYYRGLKESSAESLRKARLLMGGHPACEWSYARELARTGAWFEAAAAYRKIQGLLGAAPVLHMELATALRRAGKTDDAFAALHRLHARRFYSRATLEMQRDIAMEKGMRQEASEAQAYLEKQFGDDPAVTLAGGVLAMHSGNLAEAATILDTLSARHPDREDVEQARLSVMFAARDYEGVLKAAASSRAPAATLAPIKAAALVMLNRADDACALYEKILAGSREPLTLLSYANLLFRLDKTDRARDLYGEVLEAQPKNPVALLGLATAAVRRREWRTARGHAESAVAVAPAIAYAQVLLAEIDLAEGRPDRAAASCSKALGLAPQDERATYLLGVACLDLGRYEEAEGLLKRCAAQRPDAAAYQWQLARARLSRGAFGEALAVVDGALSRKLPGESAFQTQRLVILARMGRAADARDQLAKLAPALSPERTVLCEAWLLQQEGRTADAAAKLHGHLDDPDAAFAWAELMMMDGKPDGVAEALDRHALDAARWGRLGELARQKGSLSQAAGCYRRALRSDPDNPQLLNNFAFASLQLESFDVADVLAMAKKATLVLPGNPSVLHTYATALLRCRKEQECVELLDKSPALTRGSARLLQVHALAHERLRHWSLALQSYSACLAHPETEGVKTGDLSRGSLQLQIDLIKSKMEKR